MLRAEGVFDDSVVLVGAEHEPQRWIVARRANFAGTLFPCIGRQLAASAGSISIPVVRSPAMSDIRRRRAS